MILVCASGPRAIEIVWNEDLWPLLTLKSRSPNMLQWRKSWVWSREKRATPMSHSRLHLNSQRRIYRPYLAHATMETLNCLIDLRDDSCELWVSSQLQTADRNSAASIVGLKPEQVKLNTTYLGCGFGRKANPHSDFVSEAARVAKAARQANVKRPIKVIWTREDDTMGGYYRPLWYDRIAAGLDKDGAPVACVIQSWGSRSSPGHRLKRIL